MGKGESWASQAKENIPEATCEKIYTQWFELGGAVQLIKDTIGGDISHYQCSTVLIHLPHIVKTYNAAMNEEMYALLDDVVTRMISALVRLSVGIDHLLAFDLGAKAMSIDSIMLMTKRPDSACFVIKYL